MIEVLRAIALMCTVHNGATNRYDMRYALEIQVECQRELITCVANQPRIGDRQDGTALMECLRNRPK